MLLNLEAASIIIAHCHLQLRYQRALEDLKTKNLNIQDSAKKYAEMQHRFVQPKPHRTEDPALKPYTLPANPLSQLLPQARGLRQAL